jgi:hypothetical protein
LKVNQDSYNACNLGIKNSNGEILAFTDSDCIADKRLMDKIFIDNLVAIAIYEGKNKEKIREDWKNGQIII